MSAEKKPAALTPAQQLGLELGGGGWAALLGLEQDSEIARERLEHDTERARARRPQTLLERVDEYDHEVGTDWSRAAREDDR